MPNLHGVDLQRAIAEAKGWTDFFTNDNVYPSGHDPDKCNPRPLEYDPTEPEDIPQFHALLGELVGEGWAITISIDDDGVRISSHRFPNTTDCEMHDITAPDFCTAVGNLWLECVG